MDIPNGNITVFLDAVRRLADAECEKIDCETEAVRTQRLETLQQEAKARSDAYAQYEIARINADFNREISALEEASRKRLTERRAELEKQVFDRVRTRITAFTETPEYRDMLKKSAEQAAAAVGGRGLTVYLREADMPLAETLCADLPKDTQFVCDATISLGGVKVRAGETGLLADDTLDARLEQQKTRFLAVSGLSIEEAEE